MNKILSNKESMPKGDCFVATSAGVDSIAVAHFCKVVLRRDIKAFHINQKFTDLDDKMEESVRNFCDKFSITLTVKVDEVSIDQKLGKEASLRESRLSGYKELNSDIIVAHHLDDCVTGYLMNCLKGTPEYLPVPIKTKIDDNGHFIYRPFMLNKKDTFRNYVNSNGLESFVVEDPLNYDDNCRRNFVRMHLLPLIESRKNPNNGGKDINIDKFIKRRYLKEYLSLKA